MGHVETCVIWGDDPETRQCLGAGVPGTSGRSFQGTAAKAAVPISSPRGRSGTRGRDGRAYRFGFNGDAASGHVSREPDSKLQVRSGTARPGFSAWVVPQSTRIRLHLPGGASTHQSTREPYSMGGGGALFALTGWASDLLVELIHGPDGGGLAPGVHAGRESAGWQSDPGP